MQSVEKWLRTTYQSGKAKRSLILRKGRKVTVSLFGVLSVEGVGPGGRAV